MQIQPISLTSNPQFEGWKVNGDKILRASSGELRNYAEHFHKLKKEELVEIATVKDFFGFKMKSESNDAFVKIQGAVREVLTNVWNWKDKILYYEELKINGKRLTSDQTNNLKELKSWVKEVEEKADNCRSMYYEDKKISSNDSGSSSDNIADDINITVYTSTHYD